MILICCSHWPPQPYFVTQTCFPHFFCLNPLNAELNPICHLLALLGSATIVVVSRLRVKLVYPMCNCVDINTFIPIHCLHTVMNVDRRKFFCSQELCLNPTSSQPSILTGSELELWMVVGSRLCMVEGRYHVTARNWLYPVFHYSNKKYDIGGKTFQPILIDVGKFDVTIS